MPAPKMQPRLAARRLLVLPRPHGHPRPSQSLESPTRFFTRNSRHRARPQMSFLDTPLARNQYQQFRYLTTERKRWLMHQVGLSLKWTALFWSFVVLLLSVVFALKTEWLERWYPSPHEWRWLTRHRFRLLMWNPERFDTPFTDWSLSGHFAWDLLNRLEDPELDGAGVVKPAEGEEPSGYDITAKSEPWRRGYHQVLMMAAKAAENLDSTVLDVKRRLTFPKDVVLGPSNPNPRPISPTSASAPREDDVVRAYDAPDVFYARVLATRGFSARQKLDAALAYANWLDYKGAPAAEAARMYERAVQLAMESATAAPAAAAVEEMEIPFDARSLVLRDGAPAPSANLLNALTAFAVHKACRDDVTGALPILISVLRARRSLPNPKKDDYEARPSSRHASAWSWGNIVGTLKYVLLPPAYPPPPADGSAPPVRDAKELCEEAGLNLYIGEIIYASGGGGRKAREDGLAWTREAVDVAEEQLRRIQGGDDDDDGGGGSGSGSGSEDDYQAASDTCKDCLTTGLANWHKMVARLAREEGAKREEERASGGGTSGWFGGLLGGGSGSSSSETARLEGEGEGDGMGRWAAEEMVVRERMRRATEVLEKTELPKTGLYSLFTA